jgi:hypothetical protein
MASTRGDRLRLARVRKGFKSARLAAKALGVAISTYGAHERAEAIGGRDFGPDDAKFYGRRFGVSPEWLLTGRWIGPDNDIIKGDDPAEPVRAKVPVVGYVGAGAKTHFYELSQGELDEVDPPQGSTPATVAVEVRGESLGPFFNRWLVFYDKYTNPVTDDLIGELCVVGLEDGRILIKQLQRGRSQGLFNLLSLTEKPITDEKVAWAAKVKTISRHGRI